MPYPMSSSKSYGGGSGSTGLSYSSIPSTSYMPGFSSMLFGRHDFSSGRSPLYGGSSAGSSLGLLGLSSYSVPSYAHVSPYAVASSSYGSYGSYGSSSGPKSYYSPLPTISESHSSGPSSSGNKRRIPRTYIPVLPLPSTAGNRPALYTSSGVKTLYTEDIDVTTPRKTAKPAEITRKSSGEGYGTIRRGRTVIRLETKKLKENPYLPTPEGEQKKETKAEEPKEKEKEEKPKESVECVAPPIPPPAMNGEIKSEEKNEEKSEEKEATTELGEDGSPISKDYSQAAKWYEEEMRKPMKKEKNAGDKFREKYMVHSRKHKYSGYRRPTLSDIRAQKAVVMKEIEERLKKLSDATTSGAEVPEELKAEAQKLEKDKERLARLDKKMAKRFSRALRKDGPGDESSDDESICAERQATMKAARKLSSGTLKPSTDLPLLCNGDEDGEGNGIQGQRLTRKVTKRFFFPHEACSVVQPEIIDAAVAEEPVDIFEKNILAQRQTMKLRSTQKKVAHINQRKSSASDLEIPGNLLSDKLCDVEGKASNLEPPPEELSEEGKPSTLATLESAPGSKNASGKKKKYVKKVGDPPAKRVPGNILQPLVVPPKDSDSILESPTEEEIESAKLGKKKSVGKVNGLVSNAQKGLGLKSPFLKNNFVSKPLVPNAKLNKEVNKLTNATTAAGVGTLPGKKAGEVKPLNGKLNATPNTESSNAGAVKPVAELAPKAAAVTPVQKKGADEKKEMNDLAQVTVPLSTADKKSSAVVSVNDAGKPESQVSNALPQVKNEKSDNVKSDDKLEEGKKVVTNEEAKSSMLGAPTNKPLPVIAKLKPKLALDNKSTSLDGLKPKLKLDTKSASFDANDDKNNVGADKGAAAPTKKPFIKQGLNKQQGKQETPVPPPPSKVATNGKADEPATQIMSKSEIKNGDEKKANDPVMESKALAKLKKPENSDSIAKEPTAVDKTPVAQKKAESTDPPVKDLGTDKKPATPKKVDNTETKESGVENKIPGALKKAENATPSTLEPAADKKPVTPKKAETSEPATKEPAPVPKKEVPNVDKKEAGAKEETLKPIKKTDGPDDKVTAKATDTKQQVKATALSDNNVKKVSPTTDNDSLAKQDLTPVKVEEKKQEKPKKIDAKKIEVGDGKESNAKTVVETQKPEQKKPEETVLSKEKPVQKKEEPTESLPEQKKPEEAAARPKEKSEAKGGLALTKAAAPEDKPKEGVKSPPKQKVAPLELKEKLGIKSPPQSPKDPKQCKKPDALTSPVVVPGDQKKTEDDPQAKPVQKKGNEMKVAPEGKTPVISIPNGHLSPPSSPLGKGFGKMGNKQQAQKSPHPGEATQKEGGTVVNAAGSNDAPSAKVENLGCSTETTTNGPEKKKSDSPAVITNLPDNDISSNKLGNLSPLQASENLGANIGTNSGQKSKSSATTNTVVLNESSASVDSGIGLGGGGDDDDDTRTGPVLQRLVRKSLKRGSPRHSSGSSISSSGSSTSTAKSESGSSTSSTISAGSSAGSRRAPSPPIEDDSDEDRSTICPAKTRPKYRKYEIDDFQFLKVLGKGSFGKVLLAELKGSDSYFAIKCLKKDVVLEDDDVECTMIERKVLLMGSKHPYLCHLFCTFQTESHLFFVMEYLNGGDLMFHIQQSGRFAEERARFYGAEIVSGLKFLHKRGVIYRDLKLDNILLDYEGHIRIADFGMCKLQIYLDRMADTFCGTPDYMAPEIIRGLRYNQCVDWWAFGVLMYEMLIGQSPFSGHDEDELFWSVCNEPVHYPRFLSKESKRLLELLLEKDASKRLGTVGCVHGDVKEQPFFQPIDWERLERRELEPPFKPKLKHSLDVQYFDTTFTKEAARLTPVDKEILRSMDQTQFEGFSYTNPHTTD